MIVDGPDLPAGLDPAVFSVVDRPDGTQQLKAGKWPLYRFAGDAAPGESTARAPAACGSSSTPHGGLIKNAG